MITTKSEHGKSFKVTDGQQVQHYFTEQEIHALAKKHNFNILEIREDKHVNSENEAKAEWQVILKKEAIDNDIKYPEIADEMEKMLDEDQDMREKSHEDINYWDHEIDNRNTKRMKEIIAEIGFPTISKVGKEGCHTAWLLIQHADRDVAFQEQCLKLMKDSDPSDIILRDVAYLEDRIRLNHKQKQLYGTQFNQIDGKHVPLPIEDEDRVNERRASMGMDTLDDQIALMHRKYPLKSKGGTTEE